MLHVVATLAEGSIASLRAEVTVTLLDCQLSACVIDRARVQTSPEA